MRTLLVAFCLCFVSNLILAQASFTESGEASYYSDKLEGKSTASGEPYQAAIFTAAHKTLPFGTKVIVKNQTNGKSVIVRINDRGPFVEGRIIDLSRAAAEQIGLIQVGKAPVNLRILDEAMTAEATTTTAPPTSTVVNTSPTTTSTPPPPPSTTTTTTLPPKIISTPSGGGSAPTPIINSKTITANYAVQLGSFRDFENVGIELNRFKSYSFSDEMKIYETWKGGKRLYKLLVGPFQTREAAVGRMSNIKDAYNLDCFIFSVR